MNAHLIIIGDEILSGTTLDTNSFFLTTQLKMIGIKVGKILTIQDEISEIKKTLAMAFQETDLVLTTGGLGPTRDDKTKKAFAEYFQDKIVFDTTVFEHLRKYLIKKGRENILDQNRSQAEILAHAEVFLNDYGTAPCLLCKKEDKMAFCLPGVPYEVKPLIKEKIIPYLKNHFSKDYIVSRIVSVVGIPESILAQKIENWELNLPENFSLSYLPVGTRIKLKLTTTHHHLKNAENDLDQQINLLLPLIREHVIAVDGDKIEEILKSVLTEKKLSISCAESCTGGEISRLITSISGSSKYFLGGVCTYQTEKKTEILSVAADLIQKNTVVSEEVAEAMCLGCQKLFGTDIAVSTTGVAGPNTDDYDNQVGLVYYSVRIGDETQTTKLYLPYLERIDFMEFVAQKVLQSVIERLVKR